MKRWLAGSLCILLLLSISGCWNRREMETLAIVLGAAFDWIEEEQVYEVTVQIAKPGALASEEGGAGGGKTPPYNVVSGRGHTIFDAVRNMALVATRRLWWGHVQVVLFGEATVEHGMAEALDWLGRDGETRLIYWAIMTRGKVGALLRVESTAESIPVLGLRDTVKAVRVTGLAEHVRLLELVKEIQAPSAALIGVAMMEQAGQRMQFRVEGSGVIKENRLVGYLTGRETRGVLWVRSRVRSAVVPVACPGEERRWAGAEVIRATGKVLPRLDQAGRVWMDVRINVTAHVGDQSCQTRFDQSAASDALNATLEDVVRQEVDSGLERCRELKVDCLGLGERVMQTMPQVWSQLESRWHDDFPNLKVAVKVDASIRQLGATVRPLKPR